MRNRAVPRRQREQISSRLDNYIDNNRRVGGNPNLTDETDVYDELYKESELDNESLSKRHSIQRWNNT